MCADTDSNPRTATVPYKETSRGGEVPQPGGKDVVKGFKPQRVNNVMGSTAGSGSGDFHHYRNDRRREYFRLKKMDEDWDSKTEQEKFDAKVEANRIECEEKTRKRKNSPSPLLPSSPLFSPLSSLTPHTTHHMYRR